MSSRNRVFAIVNVPICAAILLTGAWFAGAGDLNPPAGAVAPTHKTLTEVEPRTAINATNTAGDADSLYKITAPGSYYITGNITGVASKHGIEIAASGVTLDLNGFDLVGVPAMGAFDGVSATVPNLTNIAVVNGSVRSWGGGGVDLGPLSTNCRVAEVLASGNTVDGIRTGSDCTITNCSASSNTADGVTTGDGCTVSNCSVYQNAGTGIFTGAGCTVSNCSAYQNTGDGIRTSISSTVSSCSAHRNTGTGISVSTSSTIASCSAVQNTGSGISVSTGSTVADCTARINTLDGIVCNIACVIRGNTCRDNGFNGDGAGIHATGADNRIEGNNCTTADRGIDVDFAGNIIVKNTCSGNTTNWDIAIGNALAPIVSATTNAAAVAGDTYAGSLGSTDPNANFTY
ncbi:MAG TPA: right-handed parallel beta-helix repeat-containing protein [Phycisphaerae bacterium]|nr:right-handed parallel beta-helix repeat-containing protein [Phycisphaerae bacterium]